MGKAEGEDSHDAGLVEDETGGLHCVGYGVRSIKRWLAI